MALVATLDIPVAAPLVPQLLALWTDAFGEWDQDSARVLAGSELQQNRGLVSVAGDRGRRRWRSRDRRRGADHTTAAGSTAGDASSPW